MIIKGVLIKRCDDEKVDDEKDDDEKVVACRGREKLKLYWAIIQQHKTNMFPSSACKRFDGDEYNESKEKNRIYRSHQQEASNKLQVREGKQTTQQTDV